MQFFAKYRTNRFHILQLLFWISGSSEKENKSRPKTSAGEFISSNEIYSQGNRSAGIESRAKTTAAQILCRIQIKRSYGGRTKKKLKRTRQKTETLMRSDTLEEENLQMQI